MEKREIKAVIDNSGGEGVGYIYLPKHPGKGSYNCVKKSIDIVDLIPSYKGPQVLLDFDKDNVLIGIEVIA